MMTCWHSCAPMATRFAHCLSERDVGLLLLGSGTEAVPGFLISFHLKGEEFSSKWIITLIMVHLCFSNGGLKRDSV